MSFDKSVLKTAAKCSESPGDHGTLINSLVSEDCSMLPILAVDDSMKVETLDMPLLKDSIDINIELNESNNNESCNSSVANKYCLARKIIENRSNRIDPTDIVTPISQEYNQFFGLESVDSKTNAFSDNAPLNNNIECQPEAMDILNDSKHIVDNMSTGKSPVDDCIAAKYKTNLL